MIEGRATPEGTKRFAAQKISSEMAVPEHFRESLGLSLSSIGLGTYLGQPDEQDDQRYAEAVLEAVRLGCNVIDTAINYRFQRSERSVGAALRKLTESGRAVRDEIVISTKGGYVPFDGAPPRSAREFADYLQNTFLKPGLCTREDFAAGGQHCMAPSYLEHQLARSLENLSLSTIDVYFLHNPEQQLPEVGEQEFDRRLQRAFEFLEGKVSEGKISFYGTATWNGYRDNPGEDDYLSLGRICRIAKKVAGDGHHFRVVQLPVNLAMTEAFAHQNQQADGEWISFLSAAQEFGVTVYASASILQGNVLGKIPGEMGKILAGQTDAQRAIQFTRSLPGLATALVGMKQLPHVRENLALTQVPPLPAESLKALFS